MSFENLSFGEVSGRDAELFQLASYEVNHGMLVIPNSQDEAISIQRKIVDKFNYFKNVIQKGEMTQAQIKQNVLRRNGPFPQEEYVSVDKMIEDISTPMLPQSGQEEKDFNPHDEDDVKREIDNVFEGFANALRGIVKAREEAENSASPDGKVFPLDELPEDIPEKLLEPDLDDEKPDINESELEGYPDEDENGEDSKDSEERDVSYRRKRNPRGDPPFDINSWS